MIEYPDIGYEITESATAVLEERYLFRNKDGEIIEDAFGMFKRVAQAIASVEKSPEERLKYRVAFYDLMASGNFMPNSPTLLNAGRKNYSVMSGCFVFDVEDSIYEGGHKSIFGSIALMALIHKMGGGTGCSFHKLRSAGARVTSTGHVASGPVSFMRNFNEAIEAIQQGGMRRGAHMSLIRVDHPNIEEFIICKNSLNVRTQVVMNGIARTLRLDKDGDFYKTIELAIIRSQLTNMNISVAITSEFKRALETDDNYYLVEPNTGEKVKSIKAREIFSLMAENAWKSGEPGFIDLEEINLYNTTPELGEIYLVNPCGEQPLRPYECCNLGSISLPRMLKEVDGEWVFDFKKFNDVITLAVRFLDNVIDAQSYPIKEIEEESKLTRKIGLGVMGLADTLMMLQIPYGSDRCMKFITEVMGVFKDATTVVSTQLAEEKGNFPAWDKSIYAGQDIPMRNAMRTTIAPTGTISGIAGVSFGIEPIYGLSFRRTILDGKTFNEVSKVAKSVLESLEVWNKDIEQHILEHGTLGDCSFVPDDLKPIFLTAHEVSPEKHIEVQAKFQVYIDNAVSKTINLPSRTTVKEVEEYFYKAILMNCKGMTIYRDGSRGDQVLNVGKLRHHSVRDKRPRPRKLIGPTYEKKIGECGKLFITINTDTDGYPFEIFINAGKAGGCLQSQAQAIGRLISTCWRTGLGIKIITDQLIGIKCHQSTPSISKKYSFLSCADAVARTILEHFSEEDKVDVTSKEEEIGRPVCSVCGGPLVHESNCTTCIACLDSSCS